MLKALEADKDCLNQSHKMRMATAYGLERFWGEHLRLKNGKKESDLIKSDYWKATWDALVPIMASAHLTQPIRHEEQQSLILLIEFLTRFSMLFGGFGKSWRCADHRLFYPKYYDQGRKSLIGCHWEWLGPRACVREKRMHFL